jgi:hypothetical protein
VCLFVFKLNFSKKGGKNEKNYGGSHDICYGGEFYGL